MKDVRNKYEMNLFVLIVWCIKQSKCDNYTTLIGNTTVKPRTVRGDLFPDLVGYFCYQCLPPNLVGNKNESCTLDKTNTFLGYPVECKFQFNGKSNPTPEPKPVRGCYYGITKDDKVFKGCTFQSIAVDKTLFDYEYEVDFTRMIENPRMNYTGEHGSKHSFTFREFTVCQETNCNNNGNQVLSKFHALIFASFFSKFSTFYH